MSRRALFGLGSNLGDRWAHLQAGVDGLSDAGELTAISRIYETAPVGGPGDQGPYLNCVVSVASDRDHDELLAIAHRVEAGEGRVRAERFGPRTLDVDVLWIDGYTADEEHLTVPHPRMYERAFVLAPLEEIDATLVPDHWRERMGGDDVVRAAVRPVGAMLHVPAS